MECHLASLELFQHEALLFDTPLSSFALECKGSVGKESHDSLRRLPSNDRAMPLTKYREVQRFFGKTVEIEAV